MSQCPAIQKILKKKRIIKINAKFRSNQSINVPMSRNSNKFDRKNKIKRNYKFRFNQSINVPMSRNSKKKLKYEESYKTNFSFI